jgi:hypothetical protein
MLGRKRSTRQVTKRPTEGLFAAASVVILALDG